MEQQLVCACPPLRVQAKQPRDYISGRLREERRNLIAGSAAAAVVRKWQSTNCNFVDENST